MVTFGYELDRAAKSMSEISTGGENAFSQVYQEKYTWWPIALLYICFLLILKCLI